jgi:hypothetical protein
MNITLDIPQQSQPAKPAGSPANLAAGAYPGELAQDLRLLPECGGIRVDSEPRLRPALLDSLTTSEVAYLQEIADFLADLFIDQCKTSSSPMPSSTSGYQTHAR